MHDVASALYSIQGISKCRDDELHHRDVGLEHDAELVSQTVKLCNNYMCVCV